MAESNWEGIAKSIESLGVGEGDGIGADTIASTLKGFDAVNEERVVSDPLFEVPSDDEPDFGVIPLGDLFEKPSDDSEK